MKILQLFKYKKLLAATARRASAASAGMDFGDIPEPNMKLSRALLIVLLLHVVAVAGIIAFNAIKTRQGSVAPASAGVGSRANSTLGSTIKSATSISPAPIAQKGNAKPVAKDGAKNDRAKNTAASTKMYVVAKGDNPVTIAKKFKVSYDELLALNHIDDPRKLQPGQKL